jgi:hypothetical protein
VHEQERNQGAEDVERALAREFLDTVYRLNDMAERRTTMIHHLRMQRVVGDTLAQLPINLLQQLATEAPIEEKGWEWFKASMMEVLDRRVLEDLPTDGTKH